MAENKLSLAQGCVSMGTIVLPSDQDSDLLDLGIMAVTEKRVHSIESELGQIAQRIAKLEGHKEASALPRQSPNTILIAVLSALGIAVVWYWGWIGIQVVAQGKQISQILALLSPEVIKAARPDDPQSIKQVEKVVQTALQQGKRIDPAIVSQAGNKFVDATTKTPEAWNGAVALLNYRSFLNVGTAPQLQRISPDEVKGFDFNYTYYAMKGSPLGESFWIGLSRVPDLPEMHPLTEPNENTRATVGPSFVVYKNVRLLLDNMFMKNIIIQDSRIVYRGLPMELHNVYFVNCTFEVSREARGEQFAKAVFSLSPAVTLKTT
jgi:hypothetical protein